MREIAYRLSEEITSCFIILSCWELTAVNKPGADDWRGYNYKEAGSKEAKIMSQRQDHGPHPHWVLYATSKTRRK